LAAARVLAKGLAKVLAKGLAKDLDKGPVKGFAQPGRHQDFLFKTSEINLIYNSFNIKK
jgi:hypothetical protein